MLIQLWNTQRTASALARGKITPTEKFQYLVASNLTWLGAGYVAPFIVRAPSGWLYWYECLLVLVVTVFGLIRCRDHYEGAAENRLLEAVVVLSVPLGIKFLLFTWLAHLGFARGLPWLLSGIFLTAESPIAQIDFLIKAIYTFYPFLIATVGALIYFFRLATHLRTIANETEGS